MTLMRILIVLSLAFGLFFASNWLFMLLLGAASHIFGIKELALSYWQTTIISLLLSMIGGLLRRPTYER